MFVLYIMTTTGTHWRHTIQNKRKREKESRMLESIGRCLRLSSGTDRSGVTKNRCSVIKCCNHCLRECPMLCFSFYLWQHALATFLALCGVPSQIPRFPSMLSHAFQGFGMMLVSRNWCQKKSLYTCIFVPAIWMSSGDTGLSCSTASCTSEYALLRCENFASIMTAFSTKV